MQTFSKLTLAALLLSNLAAAQILDPRNTAKRKATDRANGRIDQSIDKGFDKAEEGIGYLFRKKDKNKDKENDQTNAGQAKSQAVEGKRQTADEQPTNNISTKQNGFATYSKFDFIPGEKVIAAEDFAQDAVGDFPAKWNTDGSGEVVTMEGREGKWLKFKDGGTFYPEFVKTIPENSTIEFELAADEAHRVMTILKFVDAKLYPNLLSHRYANRVAVTLDPLGNSLIDIHDVEGSQIMSNQKEVEMWRTPDKPFVKISVWRQKSRLRVYMDETKVWDIPRAFQPNADYRVLFETNTFFIQNREVLLTDLRVASGLSDTRSKLLTEGKFVTTGILFDTNSDVIKPASYAVLKEIGQALAENPNVKIRVTGHTDNQGDDKHNLTLSARRAEAVKSALTTNWEVSAGRIETDGQGESKPIADNTTPEGRANNRRVEFTKL
jgi:OOP family OmpA-OmpF porin